jgi:hypothetical protein
MSASTSILNLAVESVMDLIDALGLYAKITRGALGTGNGYLVVREPGGKAAQIALKAAIPVESVQLSWNGSARPGRSVNFSAKLLPLNAGIRTVSWSVDADEKTAVINRKGRLTIQPGAAAGTVIKVTCTANGAPVPVTATTEITVK